MSRAAKAARQALIVERALGGEIVSKDELLELTVAQLKVVSNATLNCLGSLSTKDAIASDIHTHMRHMRGLNGAPEGYWKVV